VTHNSNHSLGVAANCRDGVFVADAPNRKSAGDIIYIWTSDGWLYFAVIHVLHSRRVVGWAEQAKVPATRRIVGKRSGGGSDRMKKDLAIRAWTWLFARPTRQSGAFFTLIAAVNIAHTTIKRSCRPIACGHQ